MSPPSKKDDEAASLVLSPPPPPPRIDSIDEDEPPTSSPKTLKSTKISKSPKTTKAPKTPKSPKKKVNKGEATEALDQQSHYSFNEEVFRAKKPGSDVDKIIRLVTQDLFAPTRDAVWDALNMLLALLKEKEESIDDSDDEDEDATKLRQPAFQLHRALAVRLGAPLMIIRRMKEFGTDESIQLSGLQILGCFAKMDTPPWLELVHCGALDRVSWAIQKSTDKSSLDHDKFWDEALGFLSDLAQSWAGTRALAEDELEKENPEEGVLGALVKTFSNKHSIVKQSLDLLYRLLCTSQDSSAVARAIAEQRQVVPGVAILMRDNPKLGEMQKKTCAVVHALIVQNQRQAVKESGALSLVSKIFANFRDKDENKELLKVAHDTMDAMAQ